MLQVYLPQPTLPKVALRNLPHHHATTVAIVVVIISHSVSVIGIESQMVVLHLHFLEPISLQYLRDMWH